MTFLTLGLFAITTSTWAESLKLNLRSQDKDVAGTKEKTKRLTWESGNTALIICDMWDDHWCKSASRRVEEMAPVLNDIVKTARAKGVFIIHAPSSVVDFYKDTPQRKLAQKAPFAKAPIKLSTSPRWGTAWCWPQDEREPGMPIDDSDMGCDCKEKCKIVPPWTRQIKTLDIREQDVITDNGQEIYNLLAEGGIDNVILMGVHLNMCVLGRPFAIRQMVNVGKNVLLIRDMTDTMYNSEKKPFVNHFRGTDLVVEHVEKYWCPSIESTDFTGKPPFRFREDPLNPKK